MKTLLFWCLLALTCSAVFSQDVKPTATPFPDSDVVKISSSLIQIDVSVTDAQGKIITNLRPDELEIFENGQKQKISNFSFVAAGQKQSDKPPAADKKSIRIPPVALRPENVRRTIAVVIDDLTMSWESVSYTRRSLRKFVDEQMQDGDLVAIIRTRAGIGALQQFTTDKRVLYAAIDKIKWNPMGTGGVTGFEPLKPSQGQTLKGAGDTTVTEGVTATDENFLNHAKDFREGVFATGTLGTLQYVVGGMSELPGRKAVMLFSDGFRLYERDKDGSPFSGTVMEYVRRLIDRANRSAVVFYAIDPRGLQYTGLTAADNTRSMSPRQMNAAADARKNDVWESQNSLNFIARETGGFALLNSNNLDGGIRRMLEDQSYYLIGYVPDGDTFDPTKNKYNKLEVRVLRKGAEVRYRSGFFGVSNSTRPAAAVDTQTPTVAQLTQALYSPFAVNGITLRLNSIFGSGGENQSYVRSLLHINAGDLNFIDDKDGAKTAKFVILATSFDAEGKLVDQIGKTYEMTLTADAYKKVMAEGFVYHFKFPVKKPGAYQFRVALRDAQSDRIGSASQFITVPDVGNNRLTLSSIVLENMSIEDYQRTGTAETTKTDPMTDTAIRVIKLGRVYRYSLEIYNAKLAADKQPNLSYRIRVFHDGKLITDGQPRPVDLAGQTDLQHIRLVSGIAIGSQMEPGEYALQIIVTDNSLKDKPQTATEFVQFEAVG